MSSRSRRRWVAYWHRLADDSGIGMVLVIGIIVFVAGLTVTASMIATHGLGQSRHRINFEQALATAEAGVDFALGNLQYAYDYSFADYPIPTPGVAPTAGCQHSAVTLPATKQEAGETLFQNTDGSWVPEQQWAQAQLVALLSGATSGGKPACLMSTPSGDVLILKPSNQVGGPSIKYGRVYARGWSPGYGKPEAVVRTIKVEYVFMPYKPKFAVLTGNSLHLQGSYLVDEATGVEPATAGVHTNGNLDVTGNGGDVSGPVSYVGMATGNTSFSSGPATKLATKVRIPRVSARALYKQAPSKGSTASGIWFDLCPPEPGYDEGVVRDYSSSGLPCTGGNPRNPSAIGLSYAPGSRLWTIGRDAPNATFFAFKADVTNGTGNPSFTTMTVIAAGSTDGCSSGRYGGNIVWDHYDTGVPHLGNLWFMADGDLKVHANYDAGSNGNPPVAGTYVAGEEIFLWTSSSFMVGSVLAAGQCPSDSGPVTGDYNEIQGESIYFTPDGDSMFSTLVDTTLWLEYTGR